VKFSGGETNYCWRLKISVYEKLNEVHLVGCGLA
jgi:hypothetical protein